MLGVARVGLRDASERLSNPAEEPGGLDDLEERQLNETEIQGTYGAAPAALSVNCVPEFGSSVAHGRRWKA